MKHITVKKSLSILFASTFALCSFNSHQAEAAGKLPTDFNEVPLYAKEVVSDLFNSNMLNGYEDGSFQPLKTVSRVEFISMIMRTYNFVENPQITTTSSIFSDYNTITQWERDVMIKAYKVGLINGSYNAITQTTSLDPTKPMTREEIVAVLVRAYELVNTQNLTFSDTALNTFKDDKDSISSWALEAMNKAVQLGLVNGTSNTTISPKDIGKRVDAALLMSRLDDKFTTFPNNLVLPTTATISALINKNNSLPNYYLLEKLADEQNFKTLNLSNSVFEITNKIDNTKTTFFALKATNSNNEQQIINVYANLDETQAAKNFFLSFSTERGLNLYIENINQLNEALKNLRHLGMSNFSFYKVVNATYFDKTYLNSSLNVNTAYQNRFIKDTDELYSVDRYGQIVNKIKINH